MSEQALIEKYFSRHKAACETVMVSIGDDAAIVNPPKNKKLVVTTDTLNAGIHFFTDCDAQYVGHKSLAVSLSDTAAMGAIPLWATLNLSLPNINHKWLEDFSNGFYMLADNHNVKLIGGDLIKGPLSITITVIGYLKTNQQLLRSNCQVNDLIYVTGFLGDAAFGLKLINDNILKISQDNLNYFLSCLYKPTPRLDVSDKITGIANAAIDISDGFLLDLQRMLTASTKGAEINVDNIPVSSQLHEYMNDDFGYNDILSGGEDYQLIFTIKPQNKIRLEEVFSNQDNMITEIGKIVTGSNIKLQHMGKPIGLPKQFGFDHFS